MAPPLIVLVHGAWHGAWCWAALQAELDRRGLASLAIDLPGHGASPLPLTDLYGDAAAVQQLVSAYAGPVVLVGHSYGGAVVTQAGTGCGNVAQLVYIAAFALDEGETVMSFIASQASVRNALSTAIVIGTDGTSTIDPQAAHAAFYGDADAMLTRANVARLSPQPFSTMTQSVSAPAWRTFPSTYVVCSRDEAVAPAHQAILAARCTQHTTLDSDHSPFVSQPSALADVLAGIVSGIVSGLATDQPPR